MAYDGRGDVPGITLKAAAAVDRVCRRPRRLHGYLMRGIRYLHPAGSQAAGGHRLGAEHDGGGYRSPSVCAQGGELMKIPQYML